MSISSTWGAPRSPAHPSQRALEQLAFDPRTTSELASAELHLGRCASCQAAVAELRRARTRFLAERPASEFLRAVEAEARPRVARGVRPLAILGGLALAAAAAVAVISAPPLVEPEAPLRLRGAGDGLRLYVSRGGGPAAPHHGERLAPGDRLRFGARSSAPGFALVVNLDREGRATTFVPAGGDQSVAIGPGAEVLLPGTIELDAVEGSHDLYLIVSSAPLERSLVEAQLVEAFHAGGDDLDRLGRVDLPAEISKVRVEIGGVP